MKIWRAFYENDIRRLFEGQSEIYSLVRSVYVAPPGRAVNGYERVGRIIAATLLGLFCLWCELVAVGFVVGMIWLYWYRFPMYLIRAVIWLAHGKNLFDMP